MIKHIDDRRVALIFSETMVIPYLTDLFYSELTKAIALKKRFNVALSGGSTPKKLYKAISDDSRAKTTPWEQVYIYFGDERAVNFDHPDSNYKMSLDSGFSKFSKIHFLPMHAYLETDKAASDYSHQLPTHMDLIFLGMGDDGHTASLFPGDPMTFVTDKPCAIGYVECKKSYRMSLSFPYINKSSKIVMLITGDNKKEMVKQVLSNHGSDFPAYHIGSVKIPAYFVLDEAAAALI